MTEDEALIAPGEDLDAYVDRLIRSTRAQTEHVGRELGDAASKALETYRERLGAAEKTYAQLLARSSATVEGPSPTRALQLRELERLRHFEATGRLP